MSYKIGDKISIKKEEKQTTLEQTFMDILSILKSKIKQDQKLQWCSTALEILENWYLEDELKSVKIAKNKLIPILEKLVEGSNIDNMASFLIIIKGHIVFVLEEILNAL